MVTTPWHHDLVFNHNVLRQREPNSVLLWFLAGATGANTCKHAPDEGSQLMQTPGICSKFVERITPAREESKKYSKYGISRCVNGGVLPFEIKRAPDALGFRNFEKKLRPAKNDN